MRPIGRAIALGDRHGQVGPHLGPRDRVTRDALLRAVRVDRERFDRILSEVPRELLAEPLLSGGWSVKDVLAHVAWGHRESVRVAHARALVGSHLWELSQDERNEAVVRESRSRSLDDVLEEYPVASDEFERAIEELTEDELNEAERFTDMPARIPGWRPWRVLYDPAHLTGHGSAIAKAIRESQRR